MNMQWNKIPPSCSLLHLLIIAAYNISGRSFFLFLEKKKETKKIQAKSIWNFPADDNRLFQICAFEFKNSRRQIKDFWLSFFVSPNLDKSLPNIGFLFLSFSRLRYATGGQA